MDLKFGQNIKFQFFLGFCSNSGRDTGRDILLVATLVATYCLSRHWSRQTATACRDILLVATSVATYCLSRHRSRHTACRDILPVATYFPVATYSPGRDILS